MMNENILSNEEATMSLFHKKRKKEKRFLKKGLYLLNKDFKDVKEPFQILKNSNIIFIVNGGIITGADSNKVLQLFVPLSIDVKKIIMVPGKQYSFVITNNSSDAQNAASILSGVVCLSGNNNPLFMCLINKVPSLESTVKYECPPGLIIIKDFINKEEEIKLAELIDWNDKPESSKEGSILNQRSVRHYGYEFDYSTNLVDKSSPLNVFPPELHSICEYIVKKNIMMEMPDQITVNRYLPGQGIPPHVDTHSAFTDKILSLSILGDITMNFRKHQSNEKRSKNPDKSEGEHFLVHLPARSLCIMTDQSRYLFTHGISSRKTDVIPSENGENKLVLKQRTERVSFTFRKVRSSSCQCLYPAKCDSQNYGKSSEKVLLKGESSNDKQICTENSTDFERDHVLNVYEEIADHFDQTRQKPWPKVLQFVESLPPASLLLDVGCGNGKYMTMMKSKFSLGVDNCQNLLHICRGKNFEASLANCLSLPFRSNAFDAVISIAVIHHLSSQERRKQALEEIIRILCEGGLGLVYVWAFEQRRGKTISTYLKKNKLNRQKIETSDSFQNEKFASGNTDNNITSTNQFNHLRIHENRTDFVEQDLFVPWKNKKKNPEILKDREEEKVFNRYYHVFREGELDELLSDSESVKILSSYYDEGNWCVSFQKTSIT